MTALLGTTLATLALVACSPPYAGESGSGATPTPSARTSAACATGSLTITEADSGRSLCVNTGSTVDVVLHGSAQQRWAPVQVGGKALRTRASGRGSVPVDVTAGFFSAAEPGSAQLASSRPACPSPPAGGVSCLARIDFQVTVTVR